VLSEQELGLSGTVSPDTATGESAERTGTGPVRHRVARHGCQGGKEVYDPENSLTLDQAYDTAVDKELVRNGQQS
jgi:hypothetical protein